MSEDRKVAIITGSSQGLGASIAIKLSQRNINLVINYSNNNITIEFYSSTSGYLSYIDNTDLFWRAYINKNEVKILKLLDTYKSIYFEKGKNLIEFKYEPFRY